MGLPAKSILNDDPRGRCDIALVRMGELVVRNGIEPACGGVKLWDNGLGELAAAYVQELGVPSTPVTAVDLFRAAGLLPQQSRRAR